MSETPDHITRMLVWLEATLALAATSKGIGMCMQSPSGERVLILILTIGLTLWLVSKALQVERTFQGRKGR